MSKNGGPAFPLSVGSEWESGMSLRDYAAIKFHAALIMVAGGDWARDPVSTAHFAARHADAMLTERDK